MSESPETSRVQDTTEKNQDRNYSFLIKIVGGAIFGGLSLVVSIISEPLVSELRTPWGLAWWDPVSVIWILSFFIFGYEAGILSSIIGMILLFITDPFAGVLGPVFKFIATIPLILIPLIIAKIRKSPLTSEYTLKSGNIAINWSFSVIVRVVLMIGFNFFAIFMFFGGSSFLNSVSLAFIGLESITGWLAFVIYVIFFNFLQSISDYLIPLLIIKPIQLALKNSLPW